MSGNIRFFGVQVGETFTVGGIEFIRFPEDQDGRVPAVAVDSLFTSRFGDSNNFAESTVLQRLKDEILPKIIEDVGKENLCTIQTDLRTWDGLKNYGQLESLISLPTMDFYRDHVEIFDRHKPSRWCWLATADSAQPHDSPWLVLCVAPSGYLGYGGYGIDLDGVRPFLLFESSIFGSSEAVDDWNTRQEVLQWL